MSKITAVLLALFLFLSSELSAATQAKKMAKQPSATQAQLLAGMLAGVRATEAEMMNLYYDHPNADMLNAFIAAVDKARDRMNAAGHRHPSQDDPGCPSGTNHCGGCGCALPVQAAIVINIPDGCIPWPPPKPRADMSAAEAMAILHGTMSSLETDILLRFVHGPTEPVVHGVMAELANVVREVSNKYEPPPK